MRFPLTAGEITLLKQLEAAGDRGRTIKGAPATHLQRLVKIGYVTDRGGGRDVVLYRITDLGRTALAAARLA